MREEVERDRQKGIHDLMKSIPPLTEHCPHFGDGLFRPIMPGDGRIGKDLDVIAGIDGYQEWMGGIRGVAVRTQRDDRRRGYPYRTFSIREARPGGEQTEYEKRLWAIKHKNEGAIFPYWTMQSYMTESGKTPLCIGLAKTEELYLWIERSENAGYRFIRRTAKNGGEQFLSIPWDMYRQTGLYFFEYTHKPQIQRPCNLKIELNVIHTTLQCQEWWDNHPEEQTAW